MLALRHSVWSASGCEKPHYLCLQVQPKNMNSKSLMDAELIAVDDKIIKVTRAKRLTEAQGFKVNLIIVFQDSARTIKLVENVKSSRGKRTRHFDVRLFHATDLISRNEVVIKHCPTGKMPADYFSKPLVGKLFRMMRRDIMNITFKK